MNLKEQTLKGTFWQILNVSLFSFMSIGYLMMMARLVEKEYHGVFALMQVIVVILSMISKAGIYLALVKRQENTEAQISFAFWASVFLGLLFTILMFFFAGNIAAIYENEFSVGVVKLISFYFLFLSLGTVSFALIVRGMNFKKLFISQCLSYFLGNIVVGLTMAYWGYQLWAFVYGFLLFTFLNSIFNYILQPHSLKFKFTYEEFKEVAHFSVGFTLTELLNSGASYIDKLIIGKYTSMSNLAIFEKGQQTPRLPVRIFGNAFDSIFYSMFSKIQNSKEEINKIFLQVSAFTWFITVYLIAFMVSFSKHIIMIILGSKWVDAIPIFQIFAFVIPLQLLTKIGDAIMRAKDELYLASRIKAVYLVLIIASSYIIASYSIQYVVYAMALVYLLYFFLMVFYSCRLVKVDFRNYVKHIISPICFGVMVWLINEALKIPFSEEVGRLVMMFLAFSVHVIFIVGLIIYFPSFFGKSTLKFLLKIVEKRNIKNPLFLKFYSKILKNVQ